MSGISKWNAYDCAFWALYPVTTACIVLSLWWATGASIALATFCGYRGAFIRYRRKP